MGWIDRPDLVCPLPSASTLKTFRCRGRTPPYTHGRPSGPGTETHLKRRTRNLRSGHFTSPTPTYQRLRSRPRSGFLQKHNWSFPGSDPSTRKSSGRTVPPPSYSRGRTRPHERVTYWTGCHVPSTSSPGKVGTVLLVHRL